MVKICSPLALTESESPFLKKPKTVLLDEP